jgi:hypothetical protein
MLTEDQEVMDVVGLHFSLNTQTCMINIGKIFQEISIDVHHLIGIYHILSQEK